MLYFFKFSSEIPAPVPAREAYHKRQPGKGWPEECPPMRAANAFGWDVLAPTDLEFVQEGGKWRLANPRVLQSDWDYTPEGEPEGEAREGVPLVQQNAWFWDEDQMLPHVISPEVYPEIDNQVKVSTFLFLSTDANELLFIGDLPNIVRPFRVLTALVDTDWYPASYPWHCVLALDRGERSIRIARGDPLCRIYTVRRDHYFAREMSAGEFDAFFRRSQEWLARHGREPGAAEGDRSDRDTSGSRGGTGGVTMDITRTYVKQQRLSKFSVIV
jgi:hypothetical protein